MRYAKIYRAIAWEGRISPEGKAVYIALAQYANKFRRCWPARKLLIKDVGRSNAIINRALNELRSWGIVEWEKGFSGRANVYTLHDERIAALIERGVDTRLSTGSDTRLSTNENHSNSVEESPAEYSA